MSRSVSQPVSAGGAGIFGRLAHSSLKVRAVRPASGPPLAFVLRAPLTSGPPLAFALRSPLASGPPLAFVLCAPLASKPKYY